MELKFEFIRSEDEKYQDWEFNYEFHILN